MYDDYTLYVEDLSIEYTLGLRRVYALNNVTFGIRKNESVGIVGESGCGKSTLAMAIGHILPQNSVVTSGRIYFNGKVIVDSEMGASFSLRSSKRERRIEESLKMVRWKGISVVFQGALDSLNPLLRVGEQISDIFIYRAEKAPDEARELSLQLLRSVGLDDWVYDAFPHQLSGGMKQRVVIAMAISLRPSLVIADEPTTSLDVLTQYKIVEELLRLRDTFNVSLLSVSHDISMISRLSDRIMVMYAGKVVEMIPSSDFSRARHPYTFMLVNSIPSIQEDISEVLPIEGSPPSLLTKPTGCPFEPRCRYATGSCREPGADEPRVVEAGHTVSCTVLPQMKRDARASSAVRESAHGPEGTPIIEVRDVTKVFSKRSGLREGKASAGSGVTALDGVNLSIYPGECVAIVGETGSGKTTLSRIVGLLDEPTSGYISYMGEKVDLKDRRAVSRLRTSIQSIFQDPFQSINPRFTVARAVAEPLEVNGLREGLEEKVMDALERVELRPVEEYMHKYPHQLSGGQRQRVAIARGLVLNPSLLIADEPISMLDVSLRAGILNLLRRLKQESGVSIMYITHDIASAKYIGDRVYVIYRGQVVESGSVGQVISEPLHPYTMALMVASRGFRGSARSELGERIFSTEEGNRDTGCLFEPRCPFSRDVCSRERPELKEISSGHSARCHFAGTLRAEAMKAQA